MNALTNAPVYDAATVARLLDLTFTETDLAAFPNPPPAIEGFITFFDPGWSILRLRSTVIGLFLQDWYDNEPFAQHEETFRYHQLRMDAIPNSFGKSFVEQQALVPPDEEIPPARVVVMGMVIHFLATGERLFPSHYVRCSDQTSGDSRVGVGDFGSDGFRVSGCWGDFLLDNLGLASSVPLRKF